MNAASVSWSEDMKSFPAHHSPVHPDIRHTSEDNMPPKMMCLCDVAFWFPVHARLSMDKTQSHKLLRLHSSHTSRKKNGTSTSFHQKIHKLLVPFPQRRMAAIVFQLAVFAVLIVNPVEINPLPFFFHVSKLKEPITNKVLEMQK